MARTMTVKVSEEEYELIKQARQALMNKGIERLEAEDVEIDWEGVALGAIVGLAAFMLTKELLKE